MNINIENFIGTFTDAYPKNYCDMVIDYFEHMDSCGYTLPRETKKIHKNDTQLFYENGSYIEYPNREIHNTFNEIFWTNIYPVYQDRYDILFEFDPHTIWTNKIQRTKVAYTLYLNDVEEGGETEFLYYPLRIKPETGKFIMWPAGYTHAHRGNPPLTNTKYIMTGWLQF
jgi:hypothetical protein